ncbi:fucolectin-like [Heptranchias perlo]|uniref:fucolectin-like n=1 Tax=Heptranchias perlo TaxID=212740 RepID=UPI00355A9678
MKSHYILVLACLWGFANAHHSTGNLAATIRATQSSILDFLGSPRNAIDGNADSSYKMGSCSSTAMQSRPWWKIDFFYHYRVYVVKITASSDGSDANTLNGAEIRIGDSPEHNGANNALCAKITSMSPGQTKLFYCAPLGVHGRFMSIIVPERSGRLALCEVEAYGAHEPH